MLSPLAASGPLLGALYVSLHAISKTRSHPQGANEWDGCDFSSAEKGGPDLNTYSPQVSVEQKSMDCIIFFVITPSRWIYNSQGNSTHFKCSGTLFIADSESHLKMSQVELKT